MKKQTKKVFITHAVTNGLQLLGVTEVESVSQVKKLIDGWEDIKIDYNPDRVTCVGQRLSRHTQDGSISGLQLTKQDTIYKYKKFWVVYTQDTSYSQIIVYL